MLSVFYFHLYFTKNKHKKDNNVCKNDDYSYIEMPKEDKVSKFNQG